jgi:signal peptidase I
MGRIRGPTAALAARRRQLICVAACLAFGGVYLLPMRLGVVCGESMSPTLRDGQVFVMRRAGAHSRLVRGDIVVLKMGKEYYVKRVYALAGETVSGLDWVETEGRPDYIASQKEMRELPQLARKRPGLGRFVRVTVPRGHVFVLGDAINSSYDSRQFGPVPMSRVCGRVIGPLFRAREDGSFPPAMARERATGLQEQPPRLWD